MLLTLFSVLGVRWVAQQSQQKPDLYNNEIRGRHSTLIHVIFQGGGDETGGWVDSEITVDVATDDGVGRVVVQVLVDWSPVGIKRDLKG